MPRMGRHLQISENRVVRLAQLCVDEIQLFGTQILAIKLLQLPWTVEWDVAGMHTGDPRSHIGAACPTRSKD